MVAGVTWSIADTMGGRRRLRETPAPGREVARAPAWKRGGGVRAYRFVLIGRTGRIERARQEQLDDDQQARAVAAGLLQAAEAFITLVEVWDGNRLVSHVRRDQD